MSDPPYYYKLWWKNIKIKQILRKSINKLETDGGTKAFTNCITDDVSKAFTNFITDEVT